MRIPRVAFFAGGASAFSAAGVMRFPGEAAQFTYKLGNQVPASHPATVHALEAAAKIGQESGGQIEIKVFPDSALGGDSQMLEQTRLGGLEFYFAGNNVLPTIVPVAGISSIPFVFDSHATAWKTMAGPLGQYVRRTIARVGNLYTFDRVWDYGFREMVNAVRPIKSPDDMKGLKMRIPISPMNVALFKALGAAPTAVSGNEVYTAMQTRLVDGADQPLAGIDSFKFYEVQKYVSMTNHAWTSVTMVANVEAWQRLPAKLQEIVERNFDRFAVRNGEDVAHSELALVGVLKAKGMLFNEADIPAFKAAVSAAGLYAQWRNELGAEAWGLLERAVGKVG